MGESLELKVIRTNFERITRLISTDPAGATWLALKLVEEAFIANAAGAVVVGHSEYNQIRVLMGAMMDKIRASQEPKNEFSKFIEILQSNSQLEELAKELDEEYDTEKSEEGKLQVVQQEVSKLEDTFGDLVLDAQEVFSEEEGKSPSLLPQLRTALKPFRTAQIKKDRHIPFFKASQKMISEVTRVGHLFYILSYYWNYYNYSLLEYLIQNFGNEGLKKKLDRYLADLQQFEKSTKVKDFVHACKSNYKLPPSSEEIAMEMKAKWADYTLDRVREPSQKLVEAACLEQFCTFFRGRSYSGASYGTDLQDYLREKRFQQPEVEEHPDLQSQQQVSRPVQPHGEHSQEHMVAFRGAKIIAETCCPISVEKPLKYEWSGYGMRIEVPKGALPPDVTSAELCIEASLAGQYEFPEDCKLVSGIFWISFPYKFLRPALLEIQHCLALTHPDQCSSLSFIVAKCTQKGLPYRFELLEGGVFTPHSSYGSISVTQFSIWGIVWKGGRAPKQYFAQLYYLPNGNNKWLLHFLIFKANHNETIKKEYTTMNAEPGPYQQVVFEANEVTLNIAKESGGWSLLPLAPPRLSREIVDAYMPGWPIPSCQIEIEWTKSGEKPGKLQLKIQLNGAKEPHDYFILTRDPIYEGPGSPSSQVPRDVHTVPTIPTKRPDIEQSEPEFSALMNEVAAKKPNKWKAIGIQLGLDINELKGFEDKYSGDPSHCFTEVLTAWKDHRTRPYTWATIIEVLESPAVGEIYLAEELKLKVTRTI